MASKREAQLTQQHTNRKVWWAVGILIVVAVAFGYPYVLTVEDRQVTFKTVAVEIGTIARVVAATGTVEPVLSVEVGSEVSGTIQSLHADYNSTVKAGDVIARIDPEPFQAKLEQERASLLSSKARLAQARAELSLKRRDLVRAKALLEKGYISQADLDVDQTEYESAVAQVDLNHALVSQATASLDAARFDLDHTVIYSPVDGTVIDRKMNAGQTVAASFQTPALFVIAEDLSRMRVIAHVGEADIAELGEDQGAKFRVDAYPNMTFEGIVTQVRIASKEDQDVVTYDVAIDVNNPKLLLKPGMTADVEIVVESVPDTLIVPNIALRFSPPEAADATAGAIAEMHKKSGPADARPNAGSTVWSPGGDGLLTQVAVEIGVADDRFTELLEGSLKRGDLVIVGIEAESGDSTARTLPPWLR